MSWKGRRVLILGLGQYPQGSGVSAARFFARLGAHVTVTDLKTTRELRENVRALKHFSNIRFVLGRHRLDDVRSADLVVPNPRVRHSSPELRLARKLGISLKTEISLFLDHCPARVIGVTGTRGKSTTSSLIAHILKQGRKKVWLGGNILVSPLTFLSRIKKDDIVVLELSSFQTESLADTKPVDIAVITNLMRDHLNAYDSMEEYAEAKAAIFRNQTPKQILILNGDDPYGRSWAEEAPSKVLFFKRSDRIPRPTFLLGEHNLQNARAAILAAKAVGATSAQISKALKTFKPLPNRLETIRTWHGITFINDTTATTPDGTIAAIKTIVPRHKMTWLILGGADKDLEYSALGKIIQKNRHRLTILLLPGDASRKIKAALRKIKVRQETVRDIATAVRSASGRASSGDCVLFSPGAASFNQYANEFERGKDFKRQVSLLR